MCAKQHKASSILVFLRIYCLLEFTLTVDNSSVPLQHCLQIPKPPDVLLPLCRNLYHDFVAKPDINMSAVCPPTDRKDHRGERFLETLERNPRKFLPCVTEKLGVDVVVKVRQGHCGAFNSVAICAHLPGSTSRRLSYILTLFQESRSGHSNPMHHRESCRRTLMAAFLCRAVCVVGSS